MKKGIVILLLVNSVIANAQSLKEALYGGKLKNDSGTVIRKGDDLSKKIDSVKKKPVDTLKMKIGATPDSIKGVSAPTDTSINTIRPLDSQTTSSVADSAKIGVDIKTEPVTTVKDNNKIWKEYMDSVVAIIKTEVLPSKKIKSGTYYVLVEYEIDTTGQVTINNVFPAPENSFIQQQVKERLNLSAPHLNPVLGTNGKPRKVIRKYNFILEK